MTTFYISPYRRMSNFRDAMERLFEENLSDKGPSEREMVLAVDVRSEDDLFVITSLVPGLETDDLNIEILNNTVTIRGEFKSPVPQENKYLVNELPVGRFNRVVTLPVGVDPAKTEASLKNGVLVLRVPKVEAHKPKMVKVSVG
jgi:HSP20 family protein